MVRRGKIRHPAGRAWRSSREHWHRRGGSTRPTCCRAHARSPARAEKRSTYSAFLIRAAVSSHRVRGLRGSAGTPPSPRPRAGASLSYGGPSRQKPQKPRPQLCRAPRPRPHHGTTVLQPASRCRSCAELPQLAVVNVAATPVAPASDRQTRHSLRSKCSAM